MSESTGSAQRRHERVSRSMTWTSSIALELGLIEGAPACIFVVGGSGLVADASWNGLKLTYLAVEP